MRRYEAEVMAAAELEAAGVFISWPGDGLPHAWGYWGVCVGSHGGRGKTLKAAMRACLRCCGIGSWWKINPPKDETPLRKLFSAVAERHLGGMAPYRPKA